ALIAMPSIVRAETPYKKSLRMQSLNSGEKLDIIFWTDQGYEPEAQVTQKGEVSLRGGILDLWPVTSPWPVRLEFFGDELDSLRFFDPITQISREEISSVTIPPGGELGILKRLATTSEEHPAPRIELATLLDYLPREAIFLLCDPEILEEQADRYSDQVPSGDSFHLTWDEFQEQISAQQFVSIEVSESSEQALESLHPEPSGDGEASLEEQPIAWSPDDADALKFQSLEIYRPIGDRPPEPQIAEAQRREFFAQLHRWLRQGYSVRVFCNNEGEKQRFTEIWAEYGFDGDKTYPELELGALSRGFIYEPAKTVVVTDAENREPMRKFLQQVRSLGYDVNVIPRVTYEHTGRVPTPQIAFIDAECRDFQMSGRTPT
ncbi:MAG: hypothetical protein ACK4UN_21990, partial [Limisphaerales bacterium]